MKTKKDSIVNYAKARSSIVRVVGDMNGLCQLTEPCGEYCTYIKSTGKDDSFLYSHAFVSSWNFGGIVILDCDNEFVAKHVIYTTMSRVLNVGVSIRQHKDFCLLLHYTGAEDECIKNTHTVSIEKTVELIKNKIVFVRFDENILDACTMFGITPNGGAIVPDANGQWFYL